MRETRVRFNKYFDDWMKAFPIGNGRVGGMVYGGPHTEKIEINEESLWAGRQLEEEYDASPEILSDIRKLLFEENYEAAKCTIKRRIDNGSGASGWSRAWTTNSYARFKDKENGKVKSLTVKSLTENTFRLKVSEDMKNIKTNKAYSLKDDVLVADFDKGECAKFQF